MKNIKMQSTFLLPYFAFFSSQFKNKRLSPFILYSKKFPDLRVKKNTFTLFSGAYFILCLFSLQNIQANEQVHWQRFEEAYQQGRVVNLVDYLSLMARREQTDTEQELTYKKNAIAYFVATGGPNGFRKSPATPTEKDTILKALSFAALLDEGEDFELTSIRRLYGRSTETEGEKTHLF